MGWVKYFGAFIAGAIAMLAWAIHVDGLKYYALSSYANGDVFIQELVGHRECLDLLASVTPLPGTSVKCVPKDTNLQSRMR